ncbi:hypothetical protein KDU71_18585 [Carboxylicivirga sediminis]|uniref:Uncharacterized protein n=1 Tax=Carboxylicivirga sediminis TaxID=2006564 RepID=A0A941IZM8_9BACT|nr:DUF6340 family protein [Carboxylicivirga sediminis]MBR8537583.1 hypothetical protein [Carboxylicivirga sediminis]
MISRISISILVVLSLFSCKSYEVMYFDVLRPAQYSVSPTIASVVIVDNAYPFNPDNAHVASVMGEMVRLDTVRVDTFTTVIIAELKKELERRRFFDTVFVDTIKYNPGYSGKPYRQLTPAQIVEICNQYNADAVLSLAGAEYGTAITVEDMEAEYYATMDVSGQVYWRLFDGYSAEGLHAKLQRDTLYWDGVGVDVNSSVGSFPSLKEATIEVAAYLGNEFADEVVPYWEQISRKVYTAGNVHFVNAAEWLAKDNRFEAEKLWGFVYEHGNSREKGRAANNIAVSLETRGELKLAMEWAYKSYEAFQAKGVTGNVEERQTSKELYLDMVRRYRDVKKLDEQIGGVE